MRRHVIVAAAAAGAVLLSAGPALASWSATGKGAAAAKAGSLNAPTNVHISSCSGTKSSGQVSGSVTVTWTVSTSTQATGQAIFTGDNGSPVTWNGTASVTVANNTTATSTFSYGPVLPATYHLGVQATKSAWGSVIAASSNTFAPTTAGPNGGCSAS